MEKLLTYCCQACTSRPYDSPVTFARDSAARSCNARVRILKGHPQCCDRLLSRKTSKCSGGGEPYIDVGIASNQFLELRNRLVSRPLLPSFNRCDSNVRIVIASSIGEGFDCGWTLQFAEQFYRVGGATAEPDRDIALPKVVEQLLAATQPERRRRIGRHRS